ncbi:MAG: glycosyltransferase [Scytolyngbya sp. HA4215-MV1]|jgi:glycosyltransferase involved in cell wall biosynthesis|nr:glycosyltransferase [Scytolyngbya sp. HA4215-MV1]
MKKVSVIIPVYGVELYIAEAIQSVLAQTYQNFELLIVDDESPDRSIEICRQFTDPRIKILNQKNRGLAGARNAGIRQATGAYLAFLDGDDLWRPEKLEKHVAHLEQYPQVGVSFSRSAFIDSHGALLGTYLMPQLTDITVQSLFRSNPVGNGSAAVVRRETLDAIRFRDNVYGQVEDFYFDDRFRRAEDIECWLRIAIQTSWQIAGIPEALTLYRVNAGGLSASLLKQFAAWEQVLEKTRSYAPDLIVQWEGVSKAYRLRYLARSAVRLQEGEMAVDLWHRSLKTHWQILLEEPKRTLRVGLAAYLLKLLPLAFYQQVEAMTTKVIGSAQKRQIMQN